MERKNLLEKMLIDEKDVLEKLVDKANKIFRVDKKTGDIVFLIPKTKLIHTELICMLLLGKYFASELKLAKSSILTIEEATKQSGLKKNIVCARLADLKKHKVAKTIKKGEYQISLTEVGRILDEILEKIGEKQSHKRGE